MKRLFDFYSKKYRVEWESLEEEIFCLYFNDDKYRLYISDDIVFLEKYNKLFRYWATVTHDHPETLEKVQELIDYYINKKTRN